jgi:hypothetical protein
MSAQTQAPADTAAVGPAAGTGVAVPASPAATVTAIYEAFGRGDVPTILSLLAEDVLWDGDWADSFAQRSPVEHYLSRRGRSQVSPSWPATRCTSSACWT